jgi:hypothetical protein
VGDGRRTVIRRIGAVALALVVAVLSAACSGQQPVPVTATAGTKGRVIEVLVEQPALAAVRSDIDLFVSRRATRVSSGGGTADAIATTVKHGYRIDAVVLPSGPALDRVADELLEPPMRLGTLRSTTYWACDIDRFGRPFAHFLATPASERVLHAHGFDVHTSP